MNRPLIETQSLVKTFYEGDSETHALDGIDIAIHEGEFVAIMGPSGSGKSTLTQILGCLDRPTSGKFYFDGREISKYSDDELAVMRNKRLGFVFQAFNLLPRLTVLENVKLPLAYARVPEPKRTNTARKVIELVGLLDRIDYRASKLSGGQKQRVAIARALVNSPKVIIADEPTGNLDSKSGEVILKLIETLHREGHTIILVTHESYVAESSERIIHLRDGKIERDEKVKSRRSVFREGLIK